MKYKLFYSYIVVINISIIIQIEYSYMQCHHILSIAILVVIAVPSQTVMLTLTSGTLDNNTLSQCYSQQNEVTVLRCHTYMQVKKHIIIKVIIIVLNNLEDTYT